jgi:TonB-dependent SusC/RagA subfamily outer membrane receptor
MNKEKTVWVTKEDDHKVYEFDHDGKNKFYISTDGKETPLFILNGKEISKKEMDDLKPDSIDKIEVLKGDSATEKYGEKGKNGVILITTKDKN